MARVATLSDVGELAGVSISVVSRLLNADPSLRIREETRQRVLAAATELRYTPNYAGRALRRSRSGAIALIVPDINSAVFADLLKGVEAGADEHDLIVLLGRAERVRAGGDVIRRLNGEGRVDGFLLQRQDDLDNEGLHQLQQVQQRKPPVVLVNSGTVRGRPSVSLDDVGAARLATEHLLELGHRRIGIVGGTVTTYTARRREQGYRAAMRDAGVTVRTDLRTTLGYTPHSGRAALAALLERPKPPTALFVANVNAAFGVLAAAHARGLTLPADLSMVAMHDVWMADSTWPPLTTVRMPLYDLGLEAVRRLVAQLTGDAPQRVVVQSPPELIVRASTAPPPPSVRFTTSTTARGRQRTIPSGRPIRTRLAEA